MDRYSEDVKNGRLPYKGTKEEQEKWIVEHIKVEFRNGYREVIGLQINKNDPMPKSNEEA